MSNKNTVVSSDKFTNVRHFHVNGKRYSACDWHEYDDVKKAWVFNGELFCTGWCKKGVTIFNKYRNELNV